MPLNDESGRSRETILPLMALRDVLVSPHAAIPLYVSREISVRAVERALITPGRRICMVAQKNPADENPGPDDLFGMGVVCRILQSSRDEDGVLQVLVEGIHRATWSPLHEEDAATNPFAEGPCPLVRVTALAPVAAPSGESASQIRVAMDLLMETSKNNRKFSPDMLASLGALQEPGQFADALLPILRADYRKRQEILETLDPLKRLDQVCILLEEELELNSLDRKIKTRVREQMDRNQREYYLTEQLRAINRELGRDDDPQAEAVELERRLNEKDMPDDVRTKAIHEVKKLTQMPPAAPEYAIVRNYIDWILDLPWNARREAPIDIAEARRILDSDHFGLEKPKQRILEYLAVQKLTGGLRGPILCLVGPPGVGKTSLARSVARATGREYLRISLGGVRDEAEIRGHRRTYVGAMPGKIIMALKRVQSGNPLFCLDEIDKMASDYRGDPASAMLEVLDPEQNRAFADHYLDLDYDLSSIFFITTANSLASIPEPLQDRMEIIELSSYLEVEKVHIARDFLIPRQLKEHGLLANQFQITDEALLELIRTYTRESGVRNLERELAALCRKTAIKLVETEETSVTVTLESLEELLGVKKFRLDDNETISQIGVVNGLAYTGAGGVLLTVETVVMPGAGKTEATGKIGDVMGESARAALSYVRSRAAWLGLRSDFHKDIDIHTHFPEGATPKDGPSAGIAITTSLVSALLGLPVCHDVAMTGEVTLRGRVLPIGGLREKLLAASRTHMKTVIIPRDNERDLKEVPQEILSMLDIRLVDHVDEVLPIALGLSRDELFRVTDEHVQLALRKPAVPGVSTAQ